jgi:hypothetical protein
LFLEKSGVETTTATAKSCAYVRRQNLGIVARETARCRRIPIREADDRFATTPICLAGLLLPFIPEAERLVMELTAP